MANVIGLARVLGTLKAVGKLGESKDVVAGHREAAKGLAGRIKTEAPQGPTGNLKRGVEFGTFKDRPGKPSASFVRMNAKIAPHALLVENGTVKSRPNPFFRRGVRAGGPAALAQAADASLKAIDNALKK